MAPKPKVNEDGGNNPTAPTAPTAPGNRTNSEIAIELRAALGDAFAEVIQEIATELMNQGSDEESSSGEEEVIYLDESSDEDLSDGLEEGIIYDHVDSEDEEENEQDTPTNPMSFVDHVMRFRKQIILHAIQPLFSLEETPSHLKELQEIKDFLSTGRCVKICSSTKSSWRGFDKSITYNHSRSHVVYSKKINITNGCFSEVIFSFVATKALIFFYEIRTVVNERTDFNYKITQFNPGSPDAENRFRTLKSRTGQVYLDLQRRHWGFDEDDLMRDSLNSNPNSFNERRRTRGMVIDDDDDDDDEDWKED